MLACPNCRAELKTKATPHGRMYPCEACGGTSVALAVLRTRFEKDTFLNRLYTSARQAGRGKGRPCPHCGGKMSLVGFSRKKGEEPTVLDVCPPCQFIWFDAHELDELAKMIPPRLPRNEELSPKARQAAAMLEVQRQQEAGTPDLPDEAARGPAHRWQYLPALLGMPVEIDTPSVQRKPLVTWSLAVAMAMIMVLLMVVPGGLEDAIRRWGFVPSDWMREGGLTLLTSFFLHAGIIHLVSNLYFLVIFGDNVEENLGPLGFLGLLLAAHLVGMLVHAAYDPRADMPCVGASAGISGVIAYYALLFPRARLGFLWILPWYLWIYRPLLWLRVRAIWALVLYVLLQSLIAWQQVLGESNISALAHLGGLSVGLAAGLFGRIAQRNQAELKTPYFRK